MADEKQLSPSDDKDLGGSDEKKKLTPEEIRKLPDEAICQLYLEEAANIRVVSSSSYETYSYRIRSLLRKLKQLGKRIVNLNPDDILELKRSLELDNIAKATIQKQLMLLSNILEILDALKVREFCWPRVVRYKRHTNVEEYRIPTPAQIFAIRRRSHTRIRDIVIFEMLMSTGCRIAELLQVRASDISFDHNVVDKDMHKLSPYIGGQFTLMPRRTRIKTHRGRICYFSVAARKWLKIYMMLLNVKDNPHIPLFPYNRTAVADWMYTLGHGVFTDMPMGSKVIDGKIDEMKRQPGFADIDTDELKGVPENIKKMIRTSQRLDKRRREKNELINKLEKLQFNSGKKHRLHPHALRHFFAGSMFLRAYNGNRHDIKVVQRLLGHRTYIMTENYLRKIQFDMAEEEWKRIFIGRQDDWPEPFTSLARVNYKQPILRHKRKNQHYRDIGKKFGRKSRKG